MDFDQKNILISTRDKFLLSASTFITFGPEDTVIIIEYKGETISLIIHFEDTDSKEMERTFEIIDETTAKISFKNYTNSLGSHTREPMRVGTIGNHNLWLVYRIVELESSASKQFTYSFYIDKEENHG